MTKHFDRRQVLVMSLGIAALTTLGKGQALADPDAAHAELERFADGASLEEGRILLDIAAEVENGSAVPASISVDSAMSDDDRVESVILLAEENPNPIVATFHFTPLSGQAKVSTRIRLAGSQTLIAAARMSDGSVFVDRKQIEVAIGGCIT